ncbi:hypothetical protein [Silvibacterium dinghuense]|uniref:Outer membrane protein beta-barrel domain-containing protein n=1 Tax=Silvibacterium dinghuense TaxID=1560006 RepID=A0A4Q1SI46_9BACT|nr:hypothetical protein [Silvibacterium dinghuense]RXS97049.1 hypothetical protein ESZ00_03730 [Silvibacterium dinghuense]
MFSLLLCSVAVLVFVPLAFAELPSAAASPAEPGGGVSSGRVTAPAQEKPLSEMALGVGISPLGIGMQAVTNLKPYMNLRLTGNVFAYSVNNISTNGFNLDASLSLASTGVSLDLYPFPGHGFRISPGLLAYSGNQATATASVAGGSELTLDNQTFYAASSNAATGATPLAGSASLKLNSNKPAFTITLGWGNHVLAKHHLSFPFEIGAAFIGSPAVRMNLSGWACTDAAQLNCASVTGTSSLATQFQSALKTQEAKWDSDLNVLQCYPILSIGVAYRFAIR